MQAPAKVLLLICASILSIILTKLLLVAELVPLLDLDLGNTKTTSSSGIPATICLVIKIIIDIHDLTLIFMAIADFKPSLLPLLFLAFHLVLLVICFWLYLVVVREGDLDRISKASHIRSTESVGRCHLWAVGIGSLVEVPALLQKNGILHVL